MKTLTISTVDEHGDVTPILELKRLRPAGISVHARRDISIKYSLDDETDRELIVQANAVATISEDAI